MNCPICSRIIERVTVTKGRECAIFVRCPFCTPEEPDYSRFFADLWGKAEVHCEEATLGEAVASLVKRLPPMEKMSPQVVGLLAHFAAVCWLIELGAGSVDDKTSAVRDRAANLARLLGPLVGEGVPL